MIFTIKKREIEKIGYHKIEIKIDILLILKNTMLSFFHFLIMIFTIKKGEIDKTVYLKIEIKIDMLLILKINLIFNNLFIYNYVFFHLTLGK